MLHFLPNYRILASSKLEAFADDKINIRIMISLFDRAGNTVGKGVNAGYQHFLLFSVFFKAFFLRVIKSGVRGCEVECRLRNLEVPSSIPGSGCQHWDFFIGPHIQHEYWCSSQEAESREISISCKNLFLN